jgi:hypothetical protein
MRGGFSILTTCIAIALSVGSTNAGTIYSENFNDPGFLSLGNSSNLPIVSFSDKYDSTNYYAINDFNNWSFTGDVWYALSGTDGAVLLNEGGGPPSPGGAAFTTVTGLIPSAAYALSFDVWGDNQPGLVWVLNVAVDGSLLLTLNGVDHAAGTFPGITETIYFTASGTSALLDFSQASLTTASPIFDNVSSTPISPTTSCASG